ncbi:MAG: hypothetical protein ABIH26_06360 [Candidatus Eisenbacteria bacterium]
MKLRYHILSGIGLGAAAGLAGAGKGEIAAAALTAGFLDVDHLVDLAVYRRTKRPGEGFFDVFNEDLWIKNFLLLHSVEILLLLVPLLFVSAHRTILLAAWAGLLLHLLLDQVGNRPYPLTYFFVYRAFRRFDARFFWRKKREGG